ncbi:DEAD/DEAH box helicase [Acetobacteraceae bacterium KSS8]|uniref:DEAD/DEAH box helicase n=1 Tax=Endosaccharibacter trunci TaxID=2812733 RepID=A0ABT1W494_9PROT|nr:DEAD/DEAH box helicase [Acetobacteraceae bacterium KSS8]
MGGAFAEAESPFDENGEPAAEAAGTEATEAAPAELDTRPLFSDLGLSEPLLRAIDEMGYKHPTPIQAQAIPYVLMGRDVLGVAQTGTGKTASFTLPLLDILSGSRARARMPRSLILEPTRELALQVAENFVMYGKYTKLTHALLIGGESMADQKAALNAGVDVLIATPGRLLDLFERGGLLMTQTRTLVIDEADRMLDMGFIPDVERIVTLLSPNRQTLFFSATMAPEIKRLADAFLQDPKEVTVSRAASVATTIVTGLALVDEHDKRKALRKLIRSEEVQNALIFCNRKRDVDMLHKSLTKHGFSSGPLHGDLAQSLRFSTLEKFKSGEIQLLVCSDVAARGIDIGGLSHVFNFDVPIHAEDYVHRIGRTGRAGRTGHAYTIASPEDRPFVEAIEKLTGKPIPPMEVEGIETAEWAEGSTRRGRGRGKSSDGRSTKSGRDESRSGAAQGAEEKPQRSERRDEQRGERRNERSDRNEPRGDRRNDRAPERNDRNERQDRSNEPRRDRYRQEDLGPAVVGFGDEIPAFMLLPIRRDRRAPDAEPEVEIDVGDDPGFDAG